VALAELQPRIQGELLLDDDSRRRYSFAECVYRIPPRGAVLPASGEDVLAVLDFARRDGVPVTARGAGTAVAGQTLGSGLILDFSRHMNRLLEVDPEGKRARVEPGIVLADLNRKLAPSGLRFAPDPASGDVCTLGGMIANNAGGPRSVRYGSTREQVVSLRAALADGEVIQTRVLERSDPRGSAEGRQVAMARTLAGWVDAERGSVAAVAPAVKRMSSGYDLLGAVNPERVDLARLLVGSEGTLAITLEAHLSLSPLPKATAVALVHFRDLEAMGEGVLVALRHAPSAVEAMDRSFLDLIREAGRAEARSLPAVTEAILILEVEGESAAGAAATLDRIEKDLVGSGLAAGMIRGLDEESRKRLWEIRKAASPILAARGGARRSTRFIEDACVPTGKLPAFFREVRRFLREQRLEGAVFGHAGDAILHVNPFLDPSDPGVGARMERIAAEYAELVLSLGGALSGEHGDGRLRTPLLSRAFGGVVEIFRKVKVLFDPGNLLSPGIKIHDGSRISDHLDLGPRPTAFPVPAMAKWAS
jgi:FAD/FMN-containing dehydrogenase